MAETFDRHSLENQKYYRNPGDEAAAQLNELSPAEQARALSRQYDLLVTNTSELRLSLPDRIVFYEKVIAIINRIIAVHDTDSTTPEDLRKYWLRSREHYEEMREQAIETLTRGNEDLPAKAEPAAEKTVERPKPKSEAEEVLPPSTKKKGAGTVGLLRRAAGGMLRMATGVWRRLAKRRSVEERQSPAAVELTKKRRSRRATQKTSPPTEQVNAEPAAAEVAPESIPEPETPLDALTHNDAVLIQRLRDQKEPLVDAATLELATRYYEQLEEMLARIPGMNTKVLQYYRTTLNRVPEWPSTERWLDDDQVVAAASERRRTKSTRENQEALAALRTEINYYSASAVNERIYAIIRGENRNKPGVILRDLSAYLSPFFEGDKSIGIRTPEKTRQLLIKIVRHYERDLAPKQSEFAELLEKLLISTARKQRSAPETKAE